MAAALPPRSLPSRKKRFRIAMRRALFRAAMMLSWCARLGGSFLTGLIACVMGHVLWLRHWRQHRDMAAGIAAALDRPLPEAQGILRRSYVDTARTSLEFLQFFADLERKSLLQHPVLPHGLEHLDAVLSAGQGAVLAGMHLGNFTYAPVWLAEQGYPVSLVAKEAKHVPPGTYRDGLASRGIEAIVVDGSPQVMQQILAALRANRAVYIAIDQGARDSELVLPFLGRPMPVAGGAALAALRSKSPLLPTILWREKDGYHLQIGKPVALPAAGPLRERIMTVTLALLEGFSGAVKAHPEQWSWGFRRRWRDQS
jgi:lauroyl/myristoyl acyltransferase